MPAFVVEELTQWWAASLYKSEDDFIFPSIRKSGEQAISPESILKREIRPALKRIGVTKQVGFHTNLLCEFKSLTKETRLFPACRNLPRCAFSPLQIC
jgi:hypothetical protein